MDSKTLLKEGSRGEDVRQLQRMLHCIADGIFGPVTKEAVVEFQKSHGLAADGIVGPLTAAALGLLQKEEPQYPTTGRKINRIILHCTATPPGMDVTAAMVRQWHIHDRGFADIGYHFLVRLDGTVEEGRPLDKIGAHCLGHNTGSIGICYAGGVDKDGKTPMDTRTPSQKQALRSLVEFYRQKYGCNVHGHYEFAAKECPSFKIEDL